MHYLINYCRRLPVFSLLLFVCACQSFSEESLEFPQTGSKLLLYGVVADGVPTVLRLSASREVLEDSLTYRIPEADVKLLAVYEDGAHYFDLHLADLQVRPITEEPNIVLPRQSAIYISDGPTTLQPGKEYSVVAVVAGYDTVRSLSLLYTPQLDTTSAELLYVTNGEEGDDCRGTGLEWSIASSRLTEGYYYLASPALVEEQGGAELIYDFQQCGCSSFEETGDTTTYKVVWDFFSNCPESFPGSSFIHRVDRSYHDFLDARNTVDLGGLFSTPRIPPNNVIGGFGYITLSERARVEYRIE